MGKKDRQRGQAEFALFDVIYEDGRMTSRRRVPIETIQGFDGEEAAWGAIREQDNSIAEKAGTSRGQIKSVTRVRGY
jgi:hypothetical protein